MAMLTCKTVEDFNALVATTANLPLFVYDREGALGGTMWYLNLRTTNRASEDDARTQASALGLREGQGGLHREMWQAAQRLLTEPR